MADAGAELERLALCWQLLAARLDVEEKPTLHDSDRGLWLRLPAHIQGPREGDVSRCNG
jgi:hypothetical protein